MGKRNRRLFLHLNIDDSNPDLPASLIYVGRHWSPTVLQFKKINQKMQGILRGVRIGQYLLRGGATPEQLHGKGMARVNNTGWRFGCATSSPNPTMQLKGLENITVAEVLMTKGAEKVGSWLWCKVDDPVIDAMGNMAENNIGSLVVLKPGDENYVAGIITERDCVRKLVAKGKSPSHTRVKEIMTNEKNLITVTSDTSILTAMRLMTENHIRHVPVIEGRIVGMISIVDVVRVVLEQQSGELERLNDYIKGQY